MVIHNSADASYDDGRMVRTASSKEASFITIASGGAQTVTIGPGSTLAGESGDTVAVPLIVTNTSVVGGEFALLANSSRGVQWVFINDIDGNGISDIGEPAVTATGIIPAGGQMRFVATGRLPAIATDRSVDSTQFIARSTANQSNAAQCLSLVVIGRPVMTLQKSADPTNPVSGGVITYTIAYANKGSGSAERFRVVDTLPGNTSFVNGSLQVNSVLKTEAADADEATISNNTLTVEIGTVAPDASGRIEFKVRIN